MITILVKLMRTLERRLLINFSKPNAEALWHLDEALGWLEGRR